MEAVLRPRGYSLVELVAAVAIAAFVLAALDSLARLAFQAQAWGRSGNTLTYDGRRALERIVAKAASVAPQPPPPASSGSSGNWFLPTVYCVNAGGQLIETTSADTGCTAAAVLAEHVTAFSVQQPADAGPVDHPVAQITITLADPQSGQSVTFTTSVRLGGGAP